ncbi:MAG: T9SS type A sorting domain-containing protein [Bacteroidota bacterium]
MKRIFLTAVTLFLLTLMGCAQWELKDIIEFQQREGLPNFYNKVRNNETVKVGFIGGSITVADGWRPKTIAWLKEQYQVDQIIDFSAAIAGTNSKYGVFRIDNHLLSKHDFDLIFVEFAVNDRDGISSDVERSMEGIVRKIWQNNPYTDICFVYTVSDKFLPDIENGKMNLSASKHDAIASHYGIPSIFWGAKIDKLLNTDEVVWYDNISNQSTSQNDAGQFVFTQDKVHPTNYGHEAYADVLQNCFMKMDQVKSVIKHEIKTPLVKNNYENSKLLSINRPNNHGMQIIETKGEKVYLDKFLKNDKWFLVSDVSTSYYAFSFVGSEFGISEIIGPSSGKYIVEVDGAKKEYTAFDPYCDYWRESFRFIRLSDNGEHFVKIYPSENKLSVAEKREILSPLRRKEDLDNYTSKYENNEYIFSHILLDGELTNYYTETLSLCEGETLVWHGDELSEGGQYLASYEMSNGFDSVYHLSLTLTPSYHGVSYDTISRGDSVFWEGQYYKDPGQYIMSYQTTTSCDSTLELNLTVTGLSSDLNISTLDDFKVYPNPSSDLISVIWNKVPEGILKLTLTNMIGEIVYATSVESTQLSQSIDLNSYPSGMYLLFIGEGENRRYTKVIKQ